MKNSNRFSDLLKHLMAVAKLKNSVLAKALRYDESYISKWVTGALLPTEKVSEKLFREMSHCIVQSLDELKTGAYGILEPPEDAPVYEPEKDTGAAVCFVPGLVYDKAGYRLGYGKGFYDRYLSAFSGCTIGVVYSDYILPVVPRGRFDVSVDILLTEKGVKITKDGKKTRK